MPWVGGAGVDGAVLEDAGVVKSGKLVRSQAIVSWMYFDQLALFKSNPHSLRRSTSRYISKYEVLDFCTITSLMMLDMLAFCIGVNSKVVSRRVASCVIKV